MVPLMAPLDDFAKAMEACGIGDGNQVVLYDRSNHAWAACIWWMLRVCGFDNAAVLNGGWQKWTVEKRPVSTQPAPYPHGSLTVKRQPHLMATKQQVVAAISSDKTKIINALPADNHSGEVVRFPRPGRIAGSVNVDCDLVTDPGAHTFLPEDRLRELFDSVDALNGKRVITYCGGGVAASLDALDCDTAGWAGCCRLSRFAGRMDRRSGFANGNRLNTGSQFLARRHQHPSSVLPHPCFLRFRRIFLSANL